VREVKSKMSVHGIQPPLTSRPKTCDMSLAEVLREEVSSVASDQAFKDRSVTAPASYSGAYQNVHQRQSHGTRPLARHSVIQSPYLTSLCN
jgi:hypothetical protein